mgnify:CR=1 FL=1
MDKYNTPEKVAAGLAELKATWDNLLGILNVDTPDDKVNRMVNIWNQYQCMVTFNLFTFCFLLRIRYRSWYGIP